MLDNLLLTDIEVEAKARVTSMDLIIRITSSQSSSEVLERAFDDTGNRVIYEFHAVRTDIKSDSDVGTLAIEQEKNLEDWLRATDIISVIRSLS